MRQPCRNESQHARSRKEYGAQLALERDLLILKVLTATGRALGEQAGEGLWVCSSTGACEGVVVHGACTCGHLQGARKGRRCLWMDEEMLVLQTGSAQINEQLN